MEASGSRLPLGGVATLLTSRTHVRTGIANGASGGAAIVYRLDNDRRASLRAGQALSAVWLGTTDRSIALPPRSAAADEAVAWQVYQRPGAGCHGGSDPAWQGGGDRPPGAGLPRQVTTLLGIVIPRGAAPRTPRRATSDTITARS